MDFMVLNGLIFSVSLLPFMVESCSSADAGIFGQQDNRIQNRKVVWSKIRKQNQPKDLSYYFLNLYLL